MNRTETYFYFQMLLSYEKLDLIFLEKLDIIFIREKKIYRQLPTINKIE
jgi:hypothetical protein